MNLDLQSHVFSLIKSIIYRICGTLCTILVSFLLTHNVQISLSIGIAEMISKILLYYLYERLWIFIIERASNRRRNT